jgi:predicted amidohydrolase YtcJ
MLEDPYLLGSNKSRRNTPRNIQIAIDAGADSIEHGNGVTDEQLKQMREKGTFFDLTPTWYDGFFTKILDATIVMSPVFRSENAAIDDRRRKRYDSLVQRVVKSGVKFAAGSDMCWFYPGKTPIADITELEHVRFLMKDGQVVRNDLASR